MSVFSCYAEEHGPPPGAAVRMVRRVGVGGCGCVARSDGHCNVQPLPKGIGEGASTWWAEHGSAASTPLKVGSEVLGSIPRNGAMGSLLVSSQSRGHQISAKRFIEHDRERAWGGGAFPTAPHTAKPLHSPLWHRIILSLFVLDRSCLTVPTPALEPSLCTAACILLVWGTPATAAFIRALSMFSRTIL